jgi:hypothetical protein
MACLPEMGVVIPALDPQRSVTRDPIGDRLDALASGARIQRRWGIALLAFIAMGMASAFSLQAMGGSGPAKPILVGGVFGGLAGILICAVGGEIQRWRLRRAMRDWRSVHSRLESPSGVDEDTSAESPGIQPDPRRVVASLAGLGGVIAFIAAAANWPAARPALYLIPIVVAVGLTIWRRR